MAEASQTNARGLPVELYETIFQQVSKSDLCSLARCSSTFQIVAESFIYHSLNSTHYLNFIKAAHYVLSCPRRHRLVRVLDLTPPIQRCNCFYNSATARLIARLLTVTLHLQAFKIHGFRPRWILSRCNHPLLTTLSIIIPNPRGRRGDNREIRIHNFRYLERHPQITKLMLWLRNGFSIEGWDPSYLFPNVETLYFTGRELHHLVKNRHLKAVYLAKDDTYNMKHTEEAILYLSGMGSTLLALDLSETRFIQETRWTSQLMHLLRNLPLLRYLGLPLFGPQTFLPLFLPLRNFNRTLLTWSWSASMLENKEGKSPHVGEVDGSSLLPGTATIPRVNGILPFELYTMIFQYLTRADLCRVARSSSILQVAAEPFLYESFESHKLKKFIKAAKSVVSCTRRHHLVRALEVFITWATGDGSGFIFRSTLTRLVTRLLMVTDQLRALQIHDDYCLRHNLDRCCHPLLNTLSIFLKPNVNGVERGLIKYVGRHPHIKRLLISDQGTKTQLMFPDPSNFLPKLETIYMSTSGPSSAVIKGRHLTRFCLAAFGGNIDRVIPYLCDMGSTLLVLDLSSCFFETWTEERKQLLERVLSSLPLLRYFGIQYTEHIENNISRIIETYFSSLEILQLRSSNDLQVPKDIALKLFPLRKSLDWIIATTRKNYAYETQSCSRAHPLGCPEDCSEVELELWSSLRDLGLASNPWSTFAVMDFKIFLGPQPRLLR
ncbi:hypothetical protein FRC03_000666 [Tulasnella sp. 419]|nr:hypothetical protein FRC03_000666 [Tulasnella sp. 419]